MLNNNLNSASQGSGRRVNNSKISSSQLFVILVHIQIGIGMISLPYEVFTKSGTDGWISVILTGILIQMIIFIFAFLINRYPNNHLFEISQLHFGKVVGRIITFIYSIYYMCIGGIFLAK